MTSSDAPKKKEYLPNIINPFEKPEKKIEKVKPTPAAVVPEPEPVVNKKLVENKLTYGVMKPTKFKPGTISSK